MVLRQVTITVLDLFQLFLEHFHGALLLGSETLLQFTLSLRIDGQLTLTHASLQVRDLVLQGLARVFEALDLCLNLATKVRLLDLLECDLLQ